MAVISIKKNMFGFIKNKKEISAIFADINKIKLFTFNRKMSPTNFLSLLKERRQVVTILTKQSG